MAEETVTGLIKNGAVGTAVLDKTGDSLSMRPGLLFARPKICEENSAHLNERERRYMVFRLLSETPEAVQTLPVDHRADGGTASWETSFDEQPLV